MIHTTRWATGHANSLFLRIHSTKGALRLDVDKSYNELDVGLGEDIHKVKWTTVKAPQTPNIYQRFITAIKTGIQGEPDFARGAEIQKALDACFESDLLGQTVKL